MRIQIGNFEPSEYLDTSQFSNCFEATPSALTGMYTLNCKNDDMKKREQGKMRSNNFMSTRSPQLVACTWQMIERIAVK